MGTIFTAVSYTHLKKDSEYAIIDYIQSMNNNLVTNDVNHNQKNETVYSDFRYFVESLRNEIVRLGNKPTQIVTVPEGTEEKMCIRDRSYCA